jgi:hypothetical protein
MVCRTLLPFACLAVSLVPAIAPAATVVVSNHGTDAGNCSTAPCWSVQHAVNHAGATDIVIGGSETYAEPVNQTKNHSAQRLERRRRGGSAAIDAQQRHRQRCVRSEQSAVPSYRSPRLRRSDPPSKRREFDGPRRSREQSAGGVLLTDENGPASRNAILDNGVLDNCSDCGITPVSHFFHSTPTARRGTACSPGRLMRLPGAMWRG